MNGSGPRYTPDVTLTARRITFKTLNLCLDAAVFGFSLWSTTKVEGLKPESGSLSHSFFFCFFFLSLIRCTVIMLFVERLNQTIQGWAPQICLLIWVTTWRFVIACHYKCGRGAMRRTEDYQNHCKPESFIQFMTSPLGAGAAGWEVRRGVKAKSWKWRDVSGDHWFVLWRLGVFPPKSEGKPFPKLVQMFHSGPKWWTPWPQTSSCWIMETKLKWAGVV